MKFNRLIPFAAVLPFFLTACGSDTPDSVAEEMTKEFESIPGIIAGVTDEASARSAAAQLNAIKDRVAALSAKGEKLGKPSKETQDKLEPRIMKAMGDAQQNMATLATKNAAAAKIVSDAMEAVGKALK